MVRKNKNHNRVVGHQSPSPLKLGNQMRNINEDKPVIAREPGKGGKGKLGAVLLGPDGKPIPGSWRSIEDLTAEKKNPPQANIDYFLKLEREKKKSQPPAPAIPTTPKPDSGKGLSPAPSKPGTPERNQPSVEKEAYDVVLDYLLSEGHADTVEEAHYVMMQLDSEYIQSIVESGYFPVTPKISQWG
jgi:hypothetical protein